MLVDLVQTTTRDGVRLDGMLRRPPPGTARTAGLDGVCCIHGTGGNFYSSTLFEAVGARLLQAGLAVLQVNTRGHDGISTAVTSRGGRRLGAAYEVLDDCRHDLLAWQEWARQSVGPRIALVGHSSGALKALYAAAHEPALAAPAVVALSPPRLSYAAFCASERRQEFLDNHRQADAMVQASRPTALLDVTLPLPLVIAAAGYVEKYGPDERYNILRFLPGVSCPVLLTLGQIEIEKNVAFRGLPGDLSALGLPADRLLVTEIAGADHFYTGVRDSLLDRIEAWLCATFPPS